MGDRCDRVNIRYVAVRVAEGLQIDRPGILFDRAFHFLQVVCVHEGGLHAVLREGMRQQVKAAAVDRLLGYDVAAVGCQGFDRVGDRRRAGSHRQRRAAALQSRHALLKHILGGIGQPAVDVAGVRQTEAVRCMLAVPEYIGCRLVNRYSARVGSRIGLFLAYVKLKGFEFILTHGFLSFIHC